MNKADRLFLCVLCPDSARLRQELNRDDIIDDDYRSSDGQELKVFSAGSWSAYRDLLEAFDIEFQETAIMQTVNLKKLTGYIDIQNYLVKV